jgi:hypothetical protein
LDLKIKRIGQPVRFFFSRIIRDVNARAGLHESSLRGAKAAKQSIALLAAIWMLRFARNDADETALAVQPLERCLMLILSA